VIKHDTGLAPHITNGICSLTVCKPKIRQYARPGEWILAFAPKAESGGEPLVKYVMKIDDNPSFEVYCRINFLKRRDAIYRYDSGKDGQWYDNGYHDHSPSEAGQEAKDKRGLHALIGSNYVHFGVYPRNLRFDLMPLCEKRSLNVDTIVSELIHTTQGQSKYCSQDAFDVFLDWVNQLPRSDSPPHTHPPFPIDGGKVVRTKRSC
jgi:hypothetical protein